MVARQIDLAAWNQETPVDQVDESISEVPRKIRSVVRSTILAEPAGHEYLRIPVVHRQLDIRIGLVIAEQDVESGLLLFDEVVFQRQRLMLVRDRDVLHIHGLPHQGSGLCVGLRRLQKVGTYPGTKVLRLPDIDHLALDIFVEVAPGLGGKCSNFLMKIHAGDQGRRLSVAATSCVQCADICSEDLTRYPIKSSRLPPLHVSAK